MIVDPPGTVSAILLRQNIWHTSSYNNLQDKYILSAMKTKLYTKRILLIIMFLNFTFEILLKLKEVQVCG